MATTKTKQTGPTIIMAAFYMLIILSGILVWIFRSSMEAKTYNRVTGSDVTTWEAMWIELRVQSEPR